MINARIEGVRELNTKIGAEIAKHVATNKAVSVSFSQHYAIYVHEDLAANHTNGEAKFLENAILRNEDAISNKLIENTRKVNIGVGLYTAGLLIQREAQKLTPVDTGALKASAQTQYEKGGI